MFSYLIFKLAVIFPSFFAAFNDVCTLPKPSFFGLPPWWKYLSVGRRDSLGVCSPVLNFSERPYEIWAILLAAVDILLRVAGMAAVVFIVIAGIQFITSAGNPDQAKGARTRIINALIGLAIVVVGIGFVSFIAKTLIT